MLLLLEFTTRFIVHQLYTCIIYIQRMQECFPDRSEAAQACCCFCPVIRDSNIVRHINLHAVTIVDNIIRRTLLYCIFQKKKLIIVFNIVQCICLIESSLASISACPDRSMRRGFV